MNQPLPASPRIDWRCLLAILLLLSSLLCAVAGETSWVVPFAGNAYVSPAQEGSSAPGRAKLQPWSAGDRTLYFRVDRATELDLSIRAKVPTGQSRIRISAAGQTWEMDVKGSEFADIPLGHISVTEGYVPVTFQGLQKSGAVCAEVESLRVKVSDAADPPVLNYVRDNENRHFYWGRRGPSVHLGYTLPKGVDVEWFYSEVSVPEGEDPIGSYFMANGFGEGYFGMQVNSATERWVLFSVWSPFRTDRPSEIPPEQRVALLRKGEGVHGGEFGGEGSGGQSYRIYPWQAGHTYCFLNRVRPEGDGTTVYTAWFRPMEAVDWQLIASFRRPQTQKHLTGAHSFLENFIDEQGCYGRRVLFRNQWAADTTGEWHQVIEARLTGDDIAKREFRLDYAGGLEGSGFFLRNGGFFSPPVKLGSIFQRPSSADRKPAIDLARLAGEH